MKREIMVTCIGFFTFFSEGCKSHSEEARPPECQETITRDRGVKTWGCPQTSDKLPPGYELVAKEGGSCTLKKTQDGRELFLHIETVGDLMLLDAIAQSSQGESGTKIHMELTCDFQPKKESGECTLITASGPRQLRCQGWEECKTIISTAHALM